LLYFKQTDRRKPANAFLGQEPIHIQPRTIRAMLELEPQNLSVDDYMPNQFGEYFLYEVNHNTFAKIGADAIFKRTYGKNLDAKESLYLLLGSDSGLLINHLYKRQLPEATRYVFIEPDTVIDAVRQRPGRPESSPEHDERIFLTTARNLMNTIGQDLWQRYLLRNKVKLHRSIGANDAHLEIYATMWRDIKSGLSGQTWDVQARSSMFIHRTVQLLNAPDNVIPAIRLTGCLHGMTAVVAAGGPSLASNLPWIQENRSKIALIAVSRVCGILLKQGITPDIVVTLDPFESSYQVSQDMLKLGQSTLLVNGHHAFCALVEGWSGPKCFLGSTFPWEDSKNCGNFVQWGPSVTNDALAVALELGCSTVILAGVDLCYSPEGKTHTEGTAEGDVGPRLMKGDTFVTTNDGTVTETAHEFLRAADNVNGFAAIAAKKGQRVINPSAHAIKLSHVAHLPLQEIDIPTPRKTAWEGIQALLPQADFNALRRHYNKLKKELRNASAEIREIKRLAEQALEQNRKQHASENDGKNAPHGARIEKIERKIARHKVFERFLKTFGIRYFFATIRIDSDADWSEQDKEKYATKYYEGYTKTADLVLEIIDFVLKRIDIREEEIKPAPNMEKLLDYWNSNEQSERSKVGGKAFMQTMGRSRFMHLKARPRAWRALRVGYYAQLPETTRAKVDALIEEQEKIGNKFIEKRLIRLKKGLSLNKLAGRAQEYFINRNVDGLKRLQRGLTIHPYAEDALQYRHLVEGYLAELEHDADTALDCYLAINLDALREITLKRQLHIQLGKHELGDAIKILRTLTNMSPFYLPYYADLLRIDNQVEQAIDIFTEYLKRHPYDMHTMMKLGMLYFQIEAYESAQWTLRHVLSKQPENIAAAEILEKIAAQQDIGTLTH
jgi:hypothetical protein